MDTNWNRIDAYAIRDALNRDHYVYAKTSAKGEEIRIFQFKHHRGLAYGRELRTGDWRVISQWQTR